MSFDIVVPDLTMGQRFNLCVGFPTSHAFGPAFLDRFPNWKESKLTYQQIRRFGDSWIQKHYNDKEKVIGHLRTLDIMNVLNFARDACQQ